MNPQPTSPRRLNRLAAALGAETYLEIGVARGMTFREIQVAQRSGVDPRYLFDVATVADATTKLFEGTSDDFFRPLPVDARFDLVFIDGLHTFEQTYRDLCSVLAHTHERSAILIDDTLPLNVYSAIPDSAKAVAYQQGTGSAAPAWHGDVYKVVFAIHDYHLALDYRTIVGSGNPQTLVWRATGVTRTPRMASLEAISRLTYFDLLDSLDVLQQCSEDEAITLCVEALA